MQEQGSDNIVSDNFRDRPWSMSRAKRRGSEKVWQFVTVVHDSV